MVGSLSFTCNDPIATVDFPPESRRQSNANNTTFLFFRLQPVGYRPPREIVGMAEYQSLTGCRTSMRSCLIGESPWLSI